MKLMNNWDMIIAAAEDPSTDIFYDQEHFALHIRDVHP